MALFVYRAVAASGRIIRGKMQAADENELTHYLEQSKLELIDAREKKQHESLFSLPLKRFSRQSLAAFCASVNELLKAGLEFPEALKNICASTPDQEFGRALTQISQSIADGKSVAGAFGGFPSLFSPVFVAIVGAGEQSGDFGAVFGYLAKLTQNELATHQRLLKALRYPLFLLCTAGGAVIFMMAMVMPQVSIFLDSLGGNLPVASRLFISVSGFSGAYGSWIATAFAFSLFAGFVLRRFSEKFRLLSDSVVLALPKVGYIVSKTEVARFARSFSILFRSGCEPADCLLQAGRVISNGRLRRGAEEARKRLVEGDALSLALEEIFPEYALGIVRLGERSGNIGRSLDDLANTYDAEATYAMDSFIATLEPALTLLIGAILAWTVLAVMAPVYGSLSVLNGQI